MLSKFDDSPKISLFSSESDAVLRDDVDFY